MSSLIRLYGTPRTNRRDNFFSNVLDGLFDESQGWRQQETFNDSVNVSETSTSHEISVAAPGLDKGDFSVELKSDTLTVSFDVSEENKNSFVKQSFQKSWAIPKGTNPSDIVAEYKSGILNVSIAKQKAEEPATTTIKVK